MPNWLWKIRAKRMPFHCCLNYSFQVYSHSEIHGNPFHQRRSAVTSRNVFCYICARKEVRMRNALLSIQCTMQNIHVSHFSIQESSDSPLRELQGWQAKDFCEDFRYNLGGYHMQRLVYNRHFAASHSRGAGEQKGHWDKTNRRHTYF